MSLLAGFDFVVEISNSYLIRMIRRTQFPGLPLLTPPFPLAMAPTDLPTVKANMHLVVKDLQLDLEVRNSGWRDWVKLTLHFSQSSILPVNRALKTMCPLGGTLSLHARVGLFPAPDNHQQVVIFMNDAEAKFSFDPASEQIVAAAVANSGGTSQQFRSQLEADTTNFVRRIPLLPLGLAYRVEGGRDGQFQDEQSPPRPALRFTSLELHCLGHADRNRQALALFGNLIEKRESPDPDPPNHTRKTATAIAPGQDIATAISPRAFRALVFCTAVRDALRQQTGNQTIQVAALPTECGTSAGLDIHEDVTLKEIRCALGNGVIQFFGSVKGSGTCYEATGIFTGNISLAVSADRRGLTPTVRMDEPHIGVSLDWYCFFAVSLIAADLTFYFMGLAEMLIEKMTKQVKEALKTSLGGGFGTSVPTGLGVNFSSVTITPEAVALQGQIPVAPRASEYFPTLSLQGSVKMLEKTVVGGGFWRTRIFCQPEEKEYRYTEYAQRQVADCSLEAQLLPMPLRAQFAVRGPSSDPAIPLLDVAPLGSNTVEIPNVECSFPMPLGTGSKITKTVHLDYVVKGTSVRLRNRPEEGNFSVNLEVAVLDCAGAPPPGVSGKQERWLTFQGSTVEMGSEYLEDFQECMDILEGFNKRYLRVQDVPRWVKAANPPVWQLVAQARALKQMQLRGELKAGEVEAIQLQTRLANVETFTEAVHSPLTALLGDEPELTVQASALESLREEVTTHINHLTRLLDDLERSATITDRVKRLDKRGK